MTMSNLDATTPEVEHMPRLGLLYQLLRVFGDVRVGEAATVLTALGQYRRLAAQQATRATAGIG